MPSSTFRIAIDDTPVCVGDEFIAHVYVDSLSEAINTVQGVLRYDAEHLTPVAVRYGDSFLRYWVTTPALPKIPGDIEFTGGLPFPGFQGSNGKVMSIVFRANTADVSSKLSIDRDAQILLNDGRATATDISYQDVLVETVAQNTAVCQAGPPIVIEQTDVTPPAPFVVIIDRTDKIFGGDYFAAYETTDDGAGVAYYEVRESSPFIQTPWQRAQSPYELRTQGGEVTLTVRAVDGAGNIRLASASQELEPIPGPITSADILVLIAAGLLAGIIYVFCRRRNRT